MRDPSEGEKDRVKWEKQYEANNPAVNPIGPNPSQKEKCRCEVDGFQGAISSVRCPIHKPEPKSFDREGFIEAANKAREVLDAQEAREPQSEWEKILREETRHQKIVTVDIDNLVDQIKKVLLEREKAVREEVVRIAEGMKKNTAYIPQTEAQLEDKFLQAGYNRALSDIISAVTTKEI